MNKIDVLDKEYNLYKKELNNINTLEYMNLAEGLNPTYNMPSQATFPITREKWELEKAKAARKAKLEILNIMDKESRGKLKVHPMPTPSNESANPILSTFHKYDKDLELNIDSTKLDVCIPLAEFIKIPSQKAKIEEFFDI
jgi:hypothetical protein